MKLFAIFALLVAIVSAEQTLWFDQMLNHFDRSSETTFHQRYYLENYATFPLDEPRFNVLFVGAEAPLNNIRPDVTHPVHRLAKENGGRVYALEHRFYGESTPQNCDLGADCLSLLTTHQALQDVAWFIHSMDAELHPNAHRPGRVIDQWLVVGGSYGGGLVAWFRNKYPHLAHGAWASSAVINPVGDFPSFDAHVQKYLHRWYPKCLEASQYAVQRAGDLVDGKFFDYIQDEALGGVASDAPTPRADDLLYMLADVASQAVQYGNTAEYCGLMHKHFRNGGFTDWMDVASDFGKFVDAHGFTVAGYSGPQLYADRTKKESGARCWWWQTCTDLAWWQTPPSTHRAESLRSSRVNTDYHRRMCASAFADAPFLAYNTSHVPPSDWAALYLGGLATIEADAAAADAARVPIWESATNTFYWNAAQDPWSEVSVRTPKHDDARNQVSVYAFNADSGRIGHCSDLHTPAADDDTELVDTRAAGEAWVKKVFASVLDF